MILRPLGRGRFCLRRVCLSFLGLSASSVLADTHAPLEFQAGFLRQSPGQPNEHAVHALQALSEQKQLPPGRYLVQITVNLAAAGSRELAFDADSSGQLYACLAPALLAELGLRLEALPDPAMLEQACLDLPQLVPGAIAEFDASQLRLNISIPQIALRRDVAGQVDPAQWQDGISAAFVSYQASLLQSDSGSRGHYASHDLYLNTGINLGGWRLRSSQAWRQDNQGQQQWTRAYTYAQHDLPGTLGTLTLGETFTSSDVFRSIPVTGVRVASDFDMLADAKRSYAPTIRGVAQSRAKLEVWQNGYPIYSTYVSPGPYAIDDLSVGSSGELEVVLTEADGQVRRFIQPYASISNLLRPGVWRYNTTLGRYNPAGGDQDPLLWQGTLAVGSAWDATFYGGLMASEGYHAGALGVARDLGAFGALSFDITRSYSEIDHQHRLQGLSYAAKYSKAFDSGTHLRFAGYRYSTEGYRDFDEWIGQRSQARTFLGSRRSRVESSILQRVGASSSLSLSLSQQDYWQRSETQRQFQLSFSTSYRSVSYSLNASQSLTEARSGNDRQVNLTVSIPLDFGRHSTLSLDLQHTANGTAQRANLSSHTDRLSYNASFAHSERQQQSAGLALAYQGPQATVGAGVSASGNQRSLSLNASGAALLHADGLELGPYLGETIGLIHVPDIAGVGLRHNSAARTNARGYALVPHLRPYRVNSLVLDTDQLGPDIEVENGTDNLVPRRGAVVKSSFQARRINRVVLTLLSGDGSPLPFGTQLHGANGDALGMVGQAGRAMLALGAGMQRIEARWGDASGERCQFQLDSNNLPEDQGYRLHTQTCG
jgi:outer membrane usher protein